MDFYVEDFIDIHSFIIKIWIEEGGDESEHPLWHGHITHVPSGKRKHIRKLDDINRFVIPYLNKMDFANGST